MLLKRFFVITLISCFSLAAFAQAKLEKINYSNLADDKYQVTLILDKQISFEIIPTANRVIVDLGNSSFAVKKFAHQLDGRFIKNIRKSTKNIDDLRIIFELADEVKFNKSYSIIQAEQLLVTVEFKSNKIIFPAESKKTTKPVIAQKYVIMIDPGHGGVDNGTVGSKLKTLEKDLALVYARELRKELSKYPQYKILMTRDKDIYLSLDKRKQQAHKMKADLFISIHADFHDDPKMHGASIYTLSHEAMDQESLALSERENKADILKNDKILKQNKEIADVLIDIMYHDTKNASINLAKVTTAELSGEIEMLQKSHRSAGLKVLKGVDTPAILIELGYLSNQEEEKSLNAYGYRKLFVRALVQGINKYTESLLQH
jgi:N-acetylmuramoyl-L-alanine amidase